MTTDVYNQENKIVGKIDLPENVFNVKWRPALVHQVLVAQLGNARKPLAHVKTRGEVRGGGKKPYAQKHTGQARAGSTRSPLWVHGGITHGPRKDRDFSKKINRKMKRLAIYSVLSRKNHDKELFVLDHLKLEKAKTKEAAKVLKNFFNRPASTLFIAEKGNRNIFLAARNIPKTVITNPDSLNVYDCLNAKYVMLEKGAVASFTE